MTDETIILGAVSLRQSRALPNMSVNNDVLGSLSLRQSRALPNMSMNNDVLDATALSVAGYQHTGGNWVDPENLSYVIIRV